MDVKAVKKAYVPEGSSTSTSGNSDFGSSNPAEKKKEVTDSDVKKEVEENNMDFTDEEVKFIYEDEHTQKRSSKIFNSIETRYVIVSFASDETTLRHKLSAYKKLLSNDIDQIAEELFGFLSK